MARSEPGHDRVVQSFESLLSEQRQEVQADHISERKELQDLHAGLQALRSKLTLLELRTQKNTQQIDILKGSASSPASKISIEEILIDQRLTQDIRLRIQDQLLPQKAQLDSLETFRREWAAAARDHLGMTTTLESVPDFVCQKMRYHDGKINLVEEKLSATQTRETIVELIEESLAAQLNAMRSQLSSLESKVSTFPRSQGYDSNALLYLEESVRNMPGKDVLVRIEESEKQIRRHQDKLEMLQQDLKSDAASLAALKRDQQRQDDQIEMCARDAQLGMRAERDLAILRQRLQELERPLREYEFHLRDRGSELQPQRPKEPAMGLERRDRIHPDLSGYR